MLARSGLMSALALVLAWLVTAVTDEGGIAWPQRFGRTLPLVPLCAALGVWAALAPALARGEVRTLAALGRSPAQIAAAACAGAVLVVFAVSLAVSCVRRVDVSGFFPTVAPNTSWHWNGAAFSDDARGLSVDALGELKTFAPRPAGLDPRVRPYEGEPPHARAAAALVIVLAGAALPLLLAHTMLSPVEVQRAGRVRRSALAWTAGTVAASIVLFQAAATLHSPSLLGVLPAFALLIVAVRRYRASS
jgi:hypothetical protein